MNNPLELTEEERLCARKKFARHLYFMEHIEVFYVPSIKGIITRSVGAKREFRLPAGSIRVGTYAHDAKPRERSSASGRFVDQPIVDDFLGDLDDVLAKQRVTLGQRSATGA